MKKIKAISVYVVMLIESLPLLALCNESESVIPNIIGLIYLAILVGLSKTRIGARVGKNIDDANKSLGL